MISSRNAVAIGVAVVWISVLSMAVTYLMFFANKGARYTASMGAQERQERMADVAALQARIETLERLVPQ